MLISFLCACSVFTPYYSETVLYSMAELLKKNEDGISILFYLQKIYPGSYLVTPYCVFSVHFVSWIFFSTLVFTVQYFLVLYMNFLRLRKSLMFNDVGLSALTIIAEEVVSFLLFYFLLSMIRSKKQVKIFKYY